MIDVVNTTDIYLNKGNSVIFTITLDGEDVPDDSTEILFVVKKAPMYAGTVISKHLTLSDGVLTVEITPEDTASLDPARYYWNLIIMFDSGLAPWTVSKDAFTFTVLPEIGSDGD